MEKAVVLQVLDAAFDVLIIRYGLFKRVYVNVSDKYFRRSLLVFLFLCIFSL